MRSTAKEVSAIERAPREACRTGHCLTVIVHNQAFANSPPPSTPPQPLPFVGSPSPSQPPPSHAPCAVRRLNITIGSQQTADPAARPRSPSLECAARPVEEVEWSRDAVVPSYQESPEICCSQFRLQQYEVSRHYPTHPPAPPESEAERSDSKRLPRRPPAKVLRNGQLMYHKAYNGPRPITYVDTRLAGATTTSRLSTTTN
jgi:hypothetical protein